MRKSILALVPAAAAVLTFGAGAAAQAATTPHLSNGGVVGTISDENGTAGYYTNSFAQTFTQVDGTFKLNIPSLDQLFALENGAIGIQLCNATTGYVAELGVWDSYALNYPDNVGSWTVGYLTGYYGGAGTGDPCDGNSIFDTSIKGGSAFTALGTVPAGTTIQAEIKEVNHGLLFTVADSQLANFQYFQKSYPGYFNEAGAGVTSDEGILSAPAVNDLVDFSNVTAVSNGDQHGFAFWNAVAVQSGYPGYSPLVVPSALNPSACTITFHPGHRYYYGKKGHRHYRWIKGYTTSSGCGASAFSVDTGSPVSIP